MQHKDIHVMK